MGLFSLLIWVKGPLEGETFTPRKYFLAKQAYMLIFPAPLVDCRIGFLLCVDVPGSQQGEQNNNDPCSGNI